MIIHLFSKLNISNLYHEEIYHEENIISDKTLYFQFDVTPLDSVYKLKE